MPHLPKFQTALVRPSALLLILLSLAACGQSFADPNTPELDSETPQPNPDVVESPTEPESPQPKQEAPNSPATERRLKVYFPKLDPNEFGAVEPVWRKTASTGVARFAIEQLLAGPTPDEQHQGLRDSFELSGSSNCGEDFQIGIENGVARLQFCRQLTYGGVGDVAGMTYAIENTLKQFDSVNQVMILDRSGNCWADESGANNCLGKGVNPEKLTPLSTIFLKGFGPIEIGMTVPEASQAAGLKLIPEPTPMSKSCSYYRLEQVPEGLADVALMVRNDKVVRIDIEDSRPKTLSGAKVGDSQQKVLDLYKGKLKVEPLPNSESGRYLTYVPQTSQDSNFRLKFITDGQTVKAITLGQQPEVNFIEGCLDVEPL
ncbi:MAG: GerMN domain-containing protein [Jaaginema sp. PMC 1080.18]|nr:GerMN domain-containing protein [Jaaginema sp. PMC 1080.18]MEC4868833.1 GerMN domain-containing protein [Jaaginema sp. PMC 1078.18]